MYMYTLTRAGITYTYEEQLIVELVEVWKNLMRAAFLERFNHIFSNH